MSQSWPAWMYGPGGQSKIFSSPEQVPAGWGDTPAAFGAGPLPTEAPPIPIVADERGEASDMPRFMRDVSLASRDELEEQARLIGLKVDGRWSDRRLNAEIERKVEMDRGDGT